MKCTALLENIRVNVQHYLKIQCIFLLPKYVN